MMEFKIAEPLEYDAKFDAHEYLLSKGYSEDWNGYHHPSYSYKMCFYCNAHL